MIIELAKDPRLPYRVLAERFEMSVNAAHKRIQLLIGKGVIGQFRTRLSFLASGGGVLEAYGRSGSMDLRETMDAIGHHPCVIRVIAASGQFLYVNALVRSMEEVTSLSTYIKEVGQIKDMDMLLLSDIAPRPERDLLNRLDRRIVRALSKDCRRPLSEVAKEVGTTSKTVKRRLEAMKASGYVTFHMDMVPTSAGDFISFIHAQLQDPSKAHEVALDLLNREDPHILGAAISSLVPGLLLISVWARDLVELQEAETSINSGDQFASLYSNLFYDMRLYDTWMDKEIMECK